MFKHGDKVTIVDPYGFDHVGTLHLPDVLMYSANGNYHQAQSTTGGYAVHTIVNQSGNLFRTEGRLQPS